MFLGLALLFKLFFFYAQQYTWQHDRLWRKNRNKYAGATCTGIDINRNFPWGFKNVSLKCQVDEKVVVIPSFSLSPLSLFSSLSPSSIPLQKPLSDACAEDYPGPKALSELETQHVIKFFREHAPIVGAIDWHSYGQLILRPWGYTNVTAPDDAWLNKLSTEMANIIKKVSCSRSLTLSCWG